MITFQGSPLTVASGSERLEEAVLVGHFGVAVIFHVGHCLHDLAILKFSERVYMTTSLSFHDLEFML